MSLFNLKTFSDFTLDLKLNSYHGPQSPKPSCPTSVSILLHVPLLLVYYLPSTQGVPWNPLRPYP